MKYSIDWHDDVVNAAAEERATVGDLRLFLHGQNVTTHLLDGRVGDHVTVALYGLVHGLVHDWWTIFGARDDRALSLRRYRSGFLLPDVRLQFDGAAFEVSAHECSYTDPDLRFWGGTSEVLTREQGEACLSGLVNDVLARLADQGIPQTGAALRWQRISSSCDSDEKAFCESAGALGLDPYDIADDAAFFIEAAEEVFGAEALVEFVSGSRGSDRQRLLEWVGRMMKEHGSAHRLSELRPVVDQVAQTSQTHLPGAAWAMGYRRARQVRNALGLAQNERFTSFTGLARRFGAAHDYDLAPSVDGISALRHEGPDGISVHLRDHGRSPAGGATHLFAMARAVGDAVCFPAREASPINRLRRAYRQAAGRAFAAEFLAPIDEIRSLQEDGRDEYSIANEFGVDRMVIMHQIDNTARIESACA